MISIRWRLTILLGLSVGALFVATGAGVYLAMKDALLGRFDETLTAKARALITASEIDGGDFEIDLSVQDFAGFGREGDDFFEIRRMNGKRFLRSPSLLMSEPGADRFEGIEPPEDGGARIEGGRLGDGRNARFYIQRIYPKDDKKDRFQDLYLIVGSPTRGVEMQLKLLATVLVIAGGTALLVMVPVIRLGLGRGLRPLNRLTSEIGEIRPEDLNRRLETSLLPAELLPVATGLNAWLARLEASFQRERRFTSHAAHELRTPLAELKSMAELGAMDESEATQARCAEMVAVTDELTTLLERLALLARTDAGRQPVHREPVNLRASIDLALKRVAGRAAERDVTFEAEVAEGVIGTDPVLWSAILQNLLGNAASHAPAGSVVRIRATSSELAIRNPAPDLRDEDIDLLFERFWRLDESRSDRGHSGLGLSIAKACVTLLGGHCVAELTSDSELEIRLSF